MACEGESGAYLGVHTHERATVKHDVSSSNYLNIGAAPSHTAQALIPLFQKPFTSPAPGKSRRFATAPVSCIRPFGIAAAYW